MTRVWRLLNGDGSENLIIWLQYINFNSYFACLKNMQKGELQGPVILLEDIL
jgi:hypothetical protein